MTTITDAPASLPRVTIYTDGGADPNPGPGGWGAVLLHAASGKVVELSGGEPHTTNNRMELTAAIRALEALKRRSVVELFTDSVYLKKGVTQWLPGWIARGWRRKDGELQNEDLWRRLAELVKLHEIRWGWVKGHAGNRYNERADKLATAAIRARRVARGGPAGGREPAAAPVAPDAEVFLKVACPGRRGAWAALVKAGGEEQVLSGVVGEGATSNALDILGAVQALESLPEGIAVAVATGSDYLRNGATGWLAGWKRSGWKTKEGAPVKNRDLWQRLDAAMSRRRVTWPAVKGEEPPELAALAKTVRAAARGEG